MKQLSILILVLVTFIGFSQAQFYGGYGMGGYGMGLGGYGYRPFHRPPPPPPPYMGYGGLGGGYGMGGYGMGMMPYGGMGMWG
uniref:Uncharacterized protein n=1 Tax=Parastrongyloides trichosuri TaxID=131310 RepID=A0A0N5A2V4_PARTI